VALERQRDAGFMGAAAEGDDALDPGREIEPGEGIRLDQALKKPGRPHDGGEAVAELGLHRLLGAPFEGTRGRCTVIEGDVTARQEGADLGEAGRFEASLVSSGIRAFSGPTPRRKAM
jgi:hypothetical protein